MSASKVNLKDTASAQPASGGRTPAWFRPKLPVRVDAELIAEMKSESDRLGRSNVRLCLHDSPQAGFHEMIIVEHRGKYYRPHKHLKKGESYHIIEGQMRVYTFEDDGKLLDLCLLSPGASFIYRVGVNMFHAIEPVTERIIYHEAKLGPFEGDGDSVWAPWAPDGADPEKAREWAEALSRRNIP